MKSCITLFLLLFVFCSGAFAQLRGALGAPNVVLQSIDARTGQPFFESQLAPEWGSIRSVSITCGSKTFVFRWPKGLIFGGDTGYKGRPADTSNFEGFLAWHYGQRGEAGKLFWNSGNRRDDKNAVLCDEEDTVGNATNNLKDVVIGKTYVNYFHVTKVTAPPFAQAEHGIFHMTVVLEGFNDTNTYTLTCQSTLVFMQTGGGQMFWCPVPEVGGAYSVNIVGDRKDPMSNRGGLIKGQREDTYQPDNSVQFDENQTSPVYLGLPELTENLKFIIDRAEKVEQPYLITSVTKH